MLAWLPGVETLPLRLDVVNIWSSTGIDDEGDWLAAASYLASYLALYLHVKPFLVHRLQVGRVREQRLFVRRHSSQDPTLRFSTPDAR